jgi:hypothetical protein
MPSTSSVSVTTVIESASYVSRKGEISLSTLKDIAPPAD